jgi:hypothetical protein
MRRPHLICLGLVLLSAAVSAARADNSIPSVPISSTLNIDRPCRVTPNPSGDLKALTDIYYRGDWTGLQTAARSPLMTCNFADDSSAFPADAFTACPAPHSANRCPNVTRDFYFVVISTSDPTGNPAVVRFLVHDPRPADPYSMTLPGVGPEPSGGVHAFQVLLSATPGMTLSTTLGIVHQQNPLTADAIAAFKASLDPAIWVPLLKNGIPNAEAGPRDFLPAGVSQTSILASVQLLSLDRRSQVSVADSVAIPPYLTKDASENLVQRVAELAHSVNAGSEHYSAQAMQIASTLRTAAIVAAGDYAYECSPPGWTDQCWNDLNQAVATAFDQTCSTAGCQQDNDVAVVRGKMLAILKTPDPQTIAGTSTITNAPLTRFSLSAISTYVIGAKIQDDRIRVDLDGSTIAPAPLPRNLNLIALEIHAPFDPNQRKVSRAERWAGFVGVVISPNAGFGTGVSTVIVRTFTFNVGYAIMWVNTLKGDDKVGGAPADSDQPFKLRPEHAVFAGFGYRFKAGS